MIPTAATASALVLVGAMMMTPIRNVNLDDFTDTVPVFLTIVMMPLTFSIAEGIVFGMLSYVILKVLTGKHKEVTPLMYGVSVLFVIKFFI